MEKTKLPEGAFKAKNGVWCVKVLYAEMEEAIRRMQRAKLALVEVSHALV